MPRAPKKVKTVLFIERILLQISHDLTRPSIRIHKELLFLQHEHEMVSPLMVTHIDQRINDYRQTKISVIYIYVFTIHNDDIPVHSWTTLVFF